MSPSSLGTVYSTLGKVEIGSSYFPSFGYHLAQSLNQAVQPRVTLFSLPSYQVLSASKTIGWPLSTPSETLPARVGPAVTSGAAGEVRREDHVELRCLRLLGRGECPERRQAEAQHDRNGGDRAVGGSPSSFLQGCFSHADGKIARKYFAEIQSAEIGGRKSR
jgi:hypothetical protein